MLYKNIYSWTYLVSAFAVTPCIFYADSALFISLLVFVLHTDEPVTEAYSLFGLHLGWGTRRDGSCMSSLPLFYISFD